MVTLSATVGPLSFATTFRHKPITICSNAPRQLQRMRSTARPCPQRDCSSHFLHLTSEFPSRPQDPSLQGISQYQLTVFPPSAGTLSKPLSESVHNQHFLRPLQTVLQHNQTCFHDQTQAPQPCGMRWTHEVFLSHVACRVSSQEHTVLCTR